MQGGTCVYFLLKQKEINTTVASLFKPSSLMHLHSVCLCSGWSAPSAIGIAGLGGGFEIGVEVSDHVLVTNGENPTFLIF